MQLAVFDVTARGASILPRTRISNDIQLHCAYVSQGCPNPWIGPTYSTAATDINEVLSVQVRLVVIQESVPAFQVAVLLVPHGTAALVARAVPRIFTPSPRRIYAVL